MSGRGGEQKLKLSWTRIPCDIVPDSTAGMAVPAACGIPVTLRRVSRAVTFVTGHGRDDAAPDWVRPAPAMPRW